MTTTTLTTCNSEQGCSEPALPKDGRCPACYVFAIGYIEDATMDAYRAMIADAR